MAIATCDDAPPDLRPLCRGDIGTLWYTNRWRRQVGLPPLPGVEIPPDILPESPLATSAWDLSCPSRGFGDTVAKALHWTGLAIVARWLLGTDCGCQSRQARWNRRWPYRPHS